MRVAGYHKIMREESKRLDGNSDDGHRVVFGGSLFPETYEDIQNERLCYSGLSMKVACSEEFGGRQQE